MTDLLTECLNLYWELGDYSIDDKRRMQAVIKALSDEVRTWAPPEGQAAICSRAINEVADRLLRDAGLAE